jgi:hypothetical protein
MKGILEGTQRESNQKRNTLWEVLRKGTLCGRYILRRGRRCSRYSGKWNSVNGTGKGAQRQCAEITAIQEKIEYIKRNTYVYQSSVPTSCTIVGTVCRCNKRGGWWSSCGKMIKERDRVLQDPISIWYFFMTADSGGKRGENNTVENNYWSVFRNAFCSNSL